MTVNLGPFQSISSYRFPGNVINGRFYYCIQRFSPTVGKVPLCVLREIRRGDVNIPVYVNSELIGWVSINFLYPEGAYYPFDVAAKMYIGENFESGEHVVFAANSFRYMEGSSWVRVFDHRGYNPITGGLCNICPGHLFVGEKYFGFDGMTNTEFPNFYLRFFFDGPSAKNVLVYNGPLTAETDVFWVLDDPDFYWEFKGTVSGATMQVKSLANNNFNDPRSLLQQSFLVGSTRIDSKDVFQLISQGEPATLTKKRMTPESQAQGFFTWKTYT